MLVPLCAIWSTVIVAILWFRWPICAVAHLCVAILVCYLYTLVRRPCVQCQAEEQKCNEPVQAEW